MSFGNQYLGLGWTQCGGNWGVWCAKLAQCCSVRRHGDRGACSPSSAGLTAPQQPSPAPLAGQRGGCVPCPCLPRHPGAQEYTWGQGTGGDPRCRCLSGCTERCTQLGISAKTFRSRRKRTIKSRSISVPISNSAVAPAAETAASLEGQPARLAVLTSRQGNTSMLRGLWGRDGRTRSAGSPHPGVPRPRTPRKRAACREP